MGPNGQDRGRNRSLAIIAWLTPTKLNSPPMRRPEIEAAQTSAKAKDLAGRCGKELQHLPSSSYRQGGGLRSALAQICTLVL
jgi:hypothetical protein